ncbi:MAG TPA: demethoxyubiquinone hydroxylase family protein [Rhizomicrobium sp.]|nr:demethoxyubiquinone hydroxylase family protein [Rhizomicrobium sp.]
MAQGRRPRKIGLQHPDDEIACRSCGPSFARTVSRILRVDYAGEYGAVRICGAQIFVAKRLHCAVVPFLVETIAHERRHAAIFRELMWPRGTRPCHAMPLWGLGGTALGLFTGCSAPTPS